MKTCFILFPLAFLLPACGHDDHGHTHPPTKANGAAPAEGEDHHGAAHALGTVKCGTYDLAVTQFGELAAGKELAVEAATAGGTEITVTVRAWIGTADAKGSRKGRLAAEGPGKLHGHLEAPDPIPEGAQLWVEVDGSDGTVAGAIALHR